MRNFFLKTKMQTSERIVLGRGFRDCSFKLRKLRDSINIYPREIMGSWRIMCSREKIRANYEKEFWVKKKKNKKEREWFRKNSKCLN